MAHHTSMKPLRDLRPTHFHRVLLGLLGVAAIVLALLAIDRVMQRNALNNAQGLATDEAAILAGGLQSELDKFSLLPLVLAEDPQVVAILGGTAPQEERLNLRLEALARQTSASAIYLMAADGLTIAASNWREPDSFVGSNYRFRRYFQQAIDAGSATQFALGTVSRKPGLYIAQRVGTQDAPLGIVAVKVEFDALEASWRGATQGVYVTDADGIILITSEENWRFHAVDPAALASRDRNSDFRQFGIAQLEVLSISGVSSGQPLVEAPLLDAEQPIAPVGWVLHLLADPSPQVAAAVANGRLALLLGIGLLTVLAAAALLLRRRREELAAAELADRTRTLRDQLMQANRLALLGQISAGVGHEISQPVAATRVFAENGRKMLETGNSEGAAGNFTRIVELTERLGRITSELRRFSRRQLSERKSMKIADAIDGATLLMRDRFVELGAKLTLPSPEETQVCVVAEHVRLEQVLVNLMQNALDATGTGGEVVMRIELEDDSVLLRVTDNGSGIAEEIADQLFQPFATDKPDGLGLGLVISRDIMRNLGGDLVCETCDRGACFTMSIPKG